MLSASLLRSSLTGRHSVVRSIRCSRRLSVLADSMPPLHVQPSIRLPSSDEQPHTGNSPYTVALPLAIGAPPAPATLDNAQQATADEHIPPPATRPSLAPRWRRAATYQSVCPQASRSSQLRPAGSPLAARSHQHAAHEQPCSDASRYHHINVYRYDPKQDSEPRMESYAVLLASCGPMLLDVLLAIKNQVDPTLALRRSCREGHSANNTYTATPHVAAVPHCAVPYCGADSWRVVLRMTDCFQASVVAAQSMSARLTSIGCSAPLATALPARQVCSQLTLLSRACVAEWSQCAGMCDTSSYYRRSSQCDECVPAATPGPTTTHQDVLLLARIAAEQATDGAGIVHGQLPRQ